MKLKTLNEMETIGRSKYGVLVSEEELRQEAIKIRKNISQILEEWDREYREGKTNKTFVTWLLDKFFNLTEEDLDDLPVTNCPLKKEKNK